MIEDQSRDSRLYCTRVLPYSSSVHKDRHDTARESRVKVRERREPTAKMDTRMAQYAKCRCTHIMRQPKQICSGLDKHLRGAKAWTMDDRTLQSHDAAISSSCRSRKRILKTRQQDDRIGTRLGLEACCLESTLKFLSRSI